MLAATKNAAETTLDAEALAIHLLSALSTCTHRLDLDALALELGVRRGDVRRTLSSLHREGFVDVLRMRPTMAGFALARAAAAGSLPAIRRLGAVARIAA